MELESGRCHMLHHLSGSSWYRSGCWNPFCNISSRIWSRRVAAGSVAAKVMSMIGVVQAGGWFAFFQSVGVTGVGATGKMVLASTVSPMCAAICGSSEEIQGIKERAMNLISEKAWLQINDIHIKFSYRTQTQ
ncbi:Hypothetical predicted protein [Mytilus galloprovincialis]|uniref:Uncharacterized protein n=1 Tax=Mytilus galloprovincialis TaxID=29158 RepID=A0A8B6DDV9_MYTGA|nr:Hypothetical predicted protein [Mytilus galloprovincialis]